MQFEKIRRKNKGIIIVGGLIGIGVIGAITILPSFAKYKVTQDINIANGVVNYKVPDINVVALYIKDEEEYIESNSIPTSGYVLNTEKSVCKIYDGSTSLENAPIDNSITIEYSNGKANFLGVNKRNTRCYLYFDKQEGLTSQDIIAANNPKSETPNFSQVATTDEGVYAVEDGMYTGTSYYWRGAVTNNYVKFANFCWRIVRINGDGSMRLIYDGDTCHANGTNTGKSIVVANVKYNANSSKSEYVGYTYTEGSQRGTENMSEIKNITDNWLKSNIIGLNNDKIANGKFCNDREIAGNKAWSSQPKEILEYAAKRRLYTNKTPTLSCLASDIYELKIGAITADEVAFAGGKWNTSNNIYYLYNGQSYWTMSPYHYYYSSSSSYHWAHVFYVSVEGMLNTNSNADTVSETNRGIRPVINLLSNTQFKLGTDGTLNNPYEVI